MIAAVLVLLMGCRPPSAVPERSALEVRYRPGEPGDAAGRELLERLQRAQWDDGLRAATGELLAATADRSARIPPSVAAAAAARVGFPGQARFARQLNGGAFPAVLLDDVRAAGRRRPLDVALSRRDYGDGMTLWVLGWAPHVVELDPLPALLALDEPLALRMESEDEADSRLFLAPPGGAVEELHVRSGVARWLDRFEAPGTYRLEVVVGEDVRSEVALLFSVFVDGPPEPLPRLTAMPIPAPDPARAEIALYAALQVLRAERGLPPVQRFPLFEPLAREHAALMAATSEVRHSIPGVTEGVPARARQQTRPAARHHESVAAAASADEAMDLITDSPAHLRSLLCEECTHVAIGAALEPSLERTPRLFITFELLEFPQGPPHPFYPSPLMPLLLPFLLACLTDPAPEPAITADTAETGSDSGGACEEAPVVTYNNFGHGFLLTYCQGCHAASAPERYGAPEAVTFDSVEEAWAWSERILARAVEVGGMPPAGGVSPEELVLLESWLTCATPGT